MIYSYQHLRRFIFNVCVKMGCPPEHAEITADILMAAELRNISSHGVSRLKDYVNLWKSNRINSNPEIKIVHETLSTGVIDGNAGLGMVVGKFAMLLAIKKAQNVGTAWVAVRNSNHFGIAGYYAMMALEHDMIGISMTNANPLVAPTFSVDRLLGTNPIAVAIPAGIHPPFVADFATTPIARGKLDIMHKKDLKAPFGFVQDKTGKSSDNPDILTQGGAILPLGGDYLHGSHKGYCLGSIVDIFSALLSGANFGPFVPPSVAYLPVLEDTTGIGTGHFFGAMRIDAFQTKDAFKQQMDLWIETFKKAQTIEGEDSVVIPGEPERKWEAVRMKEGIPVLDKVVNDLQQIAIDFKIEKL
ncbi:MAG: Ldh family oxidoreductase [Bacteroidales bacterium]